MGLLMVLSILACESAERSQCFESKTLCSSLRTVLESTISRLWDCVGEHDFGTMGEHELHRYVWGDHMYRYIYIYRHMYICVYAYTHIYMHAGIHLCVSIPHVS